MILVADSGSSKTDWRLINNDQITQFVSIGFNPDFIEAPKIREELNGIFDAPIVESVSNVYFYGSGSSSTARKSKIATALKSFFTNAKINIEHDLLGAARACSEDHEGLIGILGTGSNCCYYDGNSIAKSYRSTGYLLGDEGGGVHLGGKLIKQFIEDRLPPELKSKFDQRYQLSVDDLLYAMYKKPFPNRFIASFSTFIYHHKEHPYINQLICDSFDDYFEMQVKRFQQYQSIPLHLVGSVAFYYHEILRARAANYGVEIGKILEKPISALAIYHQSSL